jgi:8-oxo-dGTP diphosphatase
MYQYDYPHPAITTDIVIFTLAENELKVLLIERSNEPYKGRWALPGGFVDIDEDLESAALRELKEETGVTGIYLEQLYTFGKPNRDPRERVISVAYYALVPIDKLHIKPDSDASKAEWHACSSLPDLAFDHPQIVNLARDRLAAKMDYSTIALHFMPDKFTLGELQRVYETIKGTPLDKRNFRKRVLTFNGINDTGEKRMDGKHRPARLYTFNTTGTIEFIK